MLKRFGPYNKLPFELNINIKVISSILSIISPIVLTAFRDVSQHWTEKPVKKTKNQSNLNKLAADKL